MEAELRQHAFANLYNDRVRGRRTSTRDQSGRSSPTAGPASPPKKDHKEEPPGARLRGEGILGSESWVSWRFRKEKGRDGPVPASNEGPEVTTGEG